MCNTTSLSTPSNDVDNLMKETADEAGIDMAFNLPSGITSTIAAPSALPEVEQNLTERLARLRQM